MKPIQNIDFRVIVFKKFSEHLNENSLAVPRHKLCMRERDKNQLIAFWMTACLNKCHSSNIWKFIITAPAGALTCNFRFFFSKLHMSARRYDEFLENWLISYFIHSVSHFKWLTYEYLFIIFLIIEALAFSFLLQHLLIK